MELCPDCKTPLTVADRCTSCGWARPVGDTAEVSDPDGMMDTLVQEASIPNLAALFKAGKDKGLIQPQQEYGHTA